VHRVGPAYRHEREVGPDVGHLGDVVGVPGQVRPRAAEVEQVADPVVVARVYLEALRPRVVRGHRRHLQTCRLEGLAGTYGPHVTGQLLGDVVGRDEDGVRLGKPRDLR